MLIKLQSFQVIEGGMRKPGTNDVGTYFVADGPERYKLTFDTETGFVHVVRGSNTRSLHVSRVREADHDMSQYSADYLRKLGLPVAEPANDAKPYKPGAATKSLA